MEHWDLLQNYVSICLLLLTENLERDHLLVNQIVQSCTNSKDCRSMINSTHNLPTNMKLIHEPPKKTFPHGSVTVTIVINSIISRIELFAPVNGINSFLLKVKAASGSL